MQSQLTVAWVFPTDCLFRPPNLVDPPVDEAETVNSEKDPPMTGRSHGCQCGQFCPSISPFRELNANVPDNL